MALLQDDLLVCAFTTGSGYLDSRAQLSLIRATQTEDPEVGFLEINKITLPTGDINQVLVNFDEKSETCELTLATQNGVYFVEVRDKPQ